MKKPSTGELSQTGKDKETKAILLEDQISNLVYEIISSNGFPLDETLLIKGGNVLSEVTSNLSRFSDQWDIDFYKEVSAVALFFLHEERENHSRNKELQATILSELSRRQTNDKNRIRNRADQITKRAFQEAVKANLDSYDKPGEAIRDLRIKPQFEDRPDTTLRGWLKEIWKNKPAKADASRKIKK